jgi:hypothetical protein
LVKKISLSIKQGLDCFTRYFPAWPENPVNAAVVPPNFLDARLRGHDGGAFLLA